jgi:conjugative transfer signal peptidase TraF
MPSRVIASIAATVVAAVATTVAKPPMPRLVWNVSASAPMGLYSVTPGSAFARGDMVIARTPWPVRRLAAVRRYVPQNVPLVKRVAAVPGQEVCALDAFVYVDGHPIAVRRPADGRGRAMPWWRGCVRLAGGAMLLLMERSDSFDGRYFGPTSAADVLGRARLIWAPRPDA